MNTVQRVFTPERKFNAFSHSEHLKCLTFL